MMRPTANVFAAAVTLLLVTGALLACETPHSSSAPAPSASRAPDVRTDTIYVDGIGFMTKEELYTRFMNRSLYVGDEYDYTKAILDMGGPGAVDSLLAFADQYPGSPRYYVVKALVQEQVPALGTVLQRHGEDLDLAFWSEIGAALAHNGWRDSVVAHVLMDKALNTDQQSVRSAATRAFVGMGTLEEVRALAAVGDTTSSERVRQATTAAQARFDVPAFNEHVATVLRDTSQLSLRDLEGVELNHRHDFIPDLRVPLEKFRDGDPDHHLINNLEELIAELKAKKAEGIPPGAPLDYPMTTRVDSTSTR